MTIIFAFAIGLIILGSVIASTAVAARLYRAWGDGEDDRDDRGYHHGRSGERR